MINIFYAMLSVRRKFVLILLLYTIIGLFFLHFTFQNKKNPLLTNNDDDEEIFSSTYCNIYRNETIEKLHGNLPYDVKALSLPNGFDMDIYITSKADKTVILFFNKHNFEYLSLIPIMEMMRKDSYLHFIDIGANQGFYTLPLATLARHIVAVEAIDEICERNYASQYANKLNKYVTLVNNAISDRRGVVDMTMDLFRQSGRSHVVDDIEKEKLNNFTKKGQKIKQVKSILLDDLLEVIDFKKAIMKIDIEGYEAKALRGAKKLFAAIDIPMVLIEWNWQSQDQTGCNEIINFFQQRNYEPFDQLIKEKREKLDFAKSKEWPANIVWIKY